MWFQRKPEQEAPKPPEAAEAKEAPEKRGLMSWFKGKPEAKPTEAKPELTATPPVAEPPAPEAPVAPTPEPAPVEPVATPTPAPPEPAPMAPEPVAVEPPTAPPPNETAVPGADATFATADAAEATEDPKKKGFWAKTWEVLNTPVFTIDAPQLSEALEKTKTGFVLNIKKLQNRWTKIDEDMLEELEEILLESDVGMPVAEAAIEHVRAKHKKGEVSPANLSEVLEAFLREQVGDAGPLQLKPGVLNIIVMVGVNGVGKTTTLGKLADRFQMQGHKVLLAAADTFRAAAIDQIAIWAERADVELVRHKEGGDAAAVVFDAIRAAKARGADVLLVDTAGRLHNKANLMAELQKIRKIIDREAPDSPVESLLVLDATTGQNGLRQAEVFQEAFQLTGVILTKLDGTAKGGVVFGIKKQLGLPVRLMGIGEKVTDLKDFDANVFVEALFSEAESTPKP